MYQTKFKISVLVVLIFSVFSCKRELVNEDKFIRNLSNDLNFDLPLHNESLMIFINKEDTIYITSLRQLYSIKERKYKNYKDFDSFLIKALNSNLLLKSDLISKSISSFKLNKKILNEFNTKGLNYFKKVYCENSNSRDKFYIKSNLSIDIKKNIMYFFFKNNYHIMQNDYSGKYVLIDKSIKAHS